MTKKMKKQIYHEAGHIFQSLFGVLLFAAAYRLFIVPQGLYSGGFTGIAQLIKLFLEWAFHFDPAGVDLTGVIFWCLNVPILLFSYRGLGRGFFLRTILCVCVQSVLMALIPTPKEMILSDPLLNSIVGGAISGFGVGTTLRAGGSGGGNDVVGMYCAKMHPGYSVGKISNAINAFIYVFAAVMNDIDVAAYSMLFSAAASLVMDRVHTQNLKVSLLVISKKPELGKRLTEAMHRGVTSWHGVGEYTGEQTFISFVVVDQYELYRLKRLIRELDEHAFSTVLSPREVLGNFQKRLEVS